MFKNYRNFFRSVDFLFILLSILIVFITYHAWFLSTGILTFGDWGYYLPETQKEFLRLPLVWNSAFLGFVDIGLTMYPFSILAWGILAQFFNYEIVSRIIYFFPSVLFGVFGSYVLLRYFKFSPFASFVGMLVFNFNTYILLGRTGHLTLMTAFGMAPWMFYFFIRMIEEKKFYLSLIVGLLGVVTSFYELRAFYIIAIMLFSYLIFHIYVHKEFRSLKKIMQYILLGLPPAVIYVSSNIFWVIGLLQSGGVSESGVVGRALFGEGYMNILRSITLFHPFWSYSRELIFTAQPVPIYFWIIPFVALVGFITHYKKSYILFFGLLSFVGIFLTKQSGQPFPDVYNWLYHNFPGFNVFRESSKFYFVTALGFSVLIAAFVDWLVGSKKIHTIYKVSTLVVLLLLFVANIRPFVTTEVGKLFTPRMIGRDYEIFNEKINADNEFYRVIWVPRDSRWGTWGILHPKLSSVDIVQTTWKNLNQYNKQGKDYSTAEQLTDIFYKPFSDQLLDRAGVRYVVVPTSDLENEDDFIKYYGTRDYFVQKVLPLPYLEKVDFGTEELLVFENKNYHQIFSIAETSDNLDGIQTFYDLKSVTANATQYEVSIDHLNKPGFVYFSESFHPGWKMKLGEKDLFDRSTSETLPDLNHSSSIDNLNVFYVDPDYIRTHFDKSFYKKNSDGSISFKATVYFKPQELVTHSVIFSGAVFSIAFLVTIFLYIKKR